MSIGRRVSEHRRQRGITQEQLAEAMNVTSQAVSKWENDISCPDIAVLPQLADYFGISLDVLVRGENPSNVQLVPESQRKDASRLVLRMVATSTGGEYCKINLPLPLIKAALDIGIPLMQTLQINQNEAVNNTLSQIDFRSLIDLAESGVIGKLLEAQGAEGDRVDIYID